MSVAAVRHEIASLLEYGHLHVVDAKILVSQKLLGPHVSSAEHALLRDFKDKVDSGVITSSADARQVLNDAVKAGPTGLARYAASVALSAVGWGVGLAVVGAAIGIGGAALSGGAGVRDLAMAAAGSLGASVGGGVGLLYGTYRSVKD